MWWIEPFEINACVFSHIFSQYAYCTIVLLTPPKEDLTANPVTYPWQTIYLSSVLETEPSFVSGRILEALLAMAQRLRMRRLIDGPEHTARRAARHGLGVLKAGQIEIQSKMTAPLRWHPTNRN
jgi:hypothetical protein